MSARPEQNPLHLQPCPTSTDPIVRSSKRNLPLDGLRGLAILLVLLRHLVPEQTTHPYFVPIITAARLTWSGVDLFFVLSGFLIGGILLDAKNSPDYLRTFYIRRAYRILPIYCVVVCIFFIWIIWVLSDGPTSVAIPWFAYATLTQNFWMALLGDFG